MKITTMYPMRKSLRNVLTRNGVEVVKIKNSDYYQLTIADKYKNNMTNYNIIDNLIYDSCKVDEYGYDSYAKESVYVVKPYYNFDLRSWRNQPFQYGRFDI